MSLISHKRTSTDPERGLLFIISAASGTGKTTLAERLVQIAMASTIILSAASTSKA